MADDKSMMHRADAAVQAANERAEKTRKDFETWMSTSVWGAAWDVGNCCLSLLSVTMYVVQVPPITMHTSRHIR